MQAATKTHSSQPTGADAFDGQHGMLFAIWSVNSEPDMSSAIGCIDTAEDVSAITGRDNGANARPAITRIVSSRRMAEFLFTKVVSHKSAVTEKPDTSVTLTILTGTTLIRIKPPVDLSAPIIFQIDQSRSSVPRSSPADRSCCRSQSRVGRNATRDRSALLPRRGGVRPAPPKSA